jgi:DNA-binding CsgD family transcriptional regulator
LVLVAYFVSMKTNGAVISAAESEILRRASLGEDRVQVAKARGVSEETIHKQITSLLLKLECRTLHAAVERVLRDAAR